MMYEAPDSPGTRRRSGRVNRAAMMANIGEQMNDLDRTIGELPAEIPKDKFRRSSGSGKSRRRSSSASKEQKNGIESPKDQKSESVKTASPSKGEKNGASNESAKEETGKSEKATKKGVGSNGGSLKGRSSLLNVLLLVVIPFAIFYSYVVSIGPCKSVDAWPHFDMSVLDKESPRHNDALKSTQRLAEGLIFGPETVIFNRHDEMFGLTKDGLVVKINPASAATGAETTTETYLDLNKVYANEGGARPLGGAFSSMGGGRFYTWLTLLEASFALAKTGR